MPKVTAALAEGLAPLRPKSQLAQVLRWLENAAKSAGKHAVTLVVGRDGWAPTEDWSAAEAAVLGRGGGGDASRGARIRWAERDNQYKLFW